MSGRAARTDDDEVVEALLVTLHTEATPGRAEQERAYLRSELTHVGAAVPAIRRAVTALHRHHPERTHDEVVSLVDALWDQRVHELRVAAVELLCLTADRLTPDDLPHLERLVGEAGTWALVDPLATTVLGSLLQRWPDELQAELDRWAGDADHWVRRASLLAPLRALRRGDGDLERFLARADRLLDEREFFVRKAIGWVLRDVGKRAPDVVVAFLEPRLDRAAGLTVREASKHLPPDHRARLRLPPTR